MFTPPSPEAGEGEAEPGAGWEKDRGPRLLRCLLSHHRGPRRPVPVADVSVRLRGSSPVTLRPASVGEAWVHGEPQCQGPAATLLCSSAQPSGPWPSGAAHSDAGIRGRVVLPHTSPPDKADRPVLSTNAVLFLAGCQSAWGSVVVF